MLFSDYISIGAIALSLVAILISLRAERRSSEKHAWDTETTWVVEAEAPHLYETVLTFRCRGPRTVERAWVNLEDLSLWIRPLTVHWSDMGFNMIDGDSFSITIDLRDQVLNVPDTLQVNWYYSSGNFSRAFSRVRSIFAPTGHGDTKHIHNVQMREVKRELLELQEQEQQPKPEVH